MSSATIQADISYFTSPTSAIVEHELAIPEHVESLRIQQRNQTQPYIIRDGTWNPLASLRLTSVVEPLTEEEQIEIIKNAQDSIRSNTKDLDPAIRNLVSRNFKELLWK